jgi:hypothetical protein
MKFFSSTKILTLALGVACTTFALAHESQNKDQAGNDSSGSFVKADEAKVSAEWLAKATAEYPLDTCPVSGDKLEGGDMGPPVDYVYRQDGQPDRLVRLCCNHCVRDFKKDPAKYLHMIDDAAAAKAKAGSAK